MRTAKVGRERKDSYSEEERKGEGKVRTAIMEREREGHRKKRERGG